MTSTSYAYVPCPLAIINHNQMMSNERRRQASTSVVAANDNLKQTKAKGYPLQNKRTKQHSLSALSLCD